LWSGDLWWDLLIFGWRHMILYISRGSEHIAVLGTCIVHLRLFDAEWCHCMQPSLQRRGCVLPLSIDDVDNVWLSFGRYKGEFRWVALMATSFKIVACPSGNAASLGDGDHSGLDPAKRSRVCKLFDTLGMNSGSMGPERESWEFYSRT